MRTANALAAGLALVMAASVCPAPAATGLLEVEGAAAWQTRNDFAVPGGSGTRVALDRPASDPVAAGRVTLILDLGERWAVRALAAPLRLRTTFVPAGAIRFQDATFAAGVPVEHEYVFNSYRLSLFRRFRAGAAAEFRLGLTAKVRDAKLELAAGQLARGESDLGVVPLIYGGVRVALAPRLVADVDLDALGAPQGYAIDGTVRLVRSLGPALAAFAGYRLLDGGADVDRVYSFATFHYAVAGIALRR